MDRKTLIRYVLDVLLVVVIAFGSWAYGKISTLEKNQVALGARLESVEASLKEFTTGVNNLTSAVNELVTEQKIQTRLRRFEVSDRWTSEMMSEFQSIWYDIISQFHTELTLSDIPNIRRIQDSHIPISTE